MVWSSRRMLQCDEQTSVPMRYKNVSLVQLEVDCVALYVVAWSRHPVAMLNFVARPK
jgi:hypothetical protein